MYSFQFCVIATNSVSSNLYGFDEFENFQKGKCLVEKLLEMFDVKANVGELGEGGLYRVPMLHYQKGISSDDP